MLVLSGAGGGDGGDMVYARISLVHIGSGSHIRVRNICDINKFSDSLTRFDISTYYNLYYSI